MGAESTSPFKQNIKNIVYVMFENRSFDALLGWLYNGEAQPPGVNNIPANPKIKFQGLTEELLQQFAQPLKRKLSLDQDETLPIVRGVQGNFMPCSTPIVDPHEKFQFVTRQIYQNSTATGPATMKGFLQDFYEAHPKLPVHHEILQTYDFSQAPIINSLAFRYGVSDEWFCSIPSQTSINRAYSIAGNSVGYRTEADAKASPPVTTALVNNNQWGGIINYDPAPFIGTTIWNVLSENGYATEQDWKIYYSDLYLDGLFGYKTSYTYLMFEQLQKLLNPDKKETVSDPRYQNIETFYADCKAGTLPRFSYLEPKYTWEIFAEIGIHGTDYHPPSDIRRGEAFLQGIYNHLTASPQWEDTLLVIAFDEHGGTFDHIPPPTGATDPGGADKSECGFDFKRYGVRVPMIFVSPWVKEHTIIRSDCPGTPFDHTSWLATLLHWFDLDPALLGNRTAIAPKFCDVIGNQKRKAVPLPALFDCQSQAGLPDRALTAELAEMISKFLKAAHPETDRLEILKEILEKTGTEKELYQFARDFKPDQ